jgi:hypothetical protein
MADHEGEHEKRQRELRRKEFEQIAQIVVHSICSMNRRQNVVADPGTKYALLVDKMCVVLDIAIGALYAQMEELEVSENIRTQIEDTSQNMHKQLNELMSWILSPSYSPDHAFGNAVMRGAQNDMNYRAETGGDKPN